MLKNRKNQFYRKIDLQTTANEVDERISFNVLEEVKNMMK